MDGIEYTNAIPNFTNLAWGGDIEIKGMKGGKTGRTSNFKKAYEALSEKTGMSIEELKSIKSDFDLVWHECNDTKTM